MCCVWSYFKAASKPTFELPSSSCLLCSCPLFLPPPQLPLSLQLRHPRSVLAITCRLSRSPLLQAILSCVLFNYTNQCDSSLNGPQSSTSQVGKVRLWEAAHVSSVHNNKWRQKLKFKHTLALPQTSQKLQVKPAQQADVECLTLNESHFNFPLRRLLLLSSQTPTSSGSTNYLPFRGALQD